MQHYPCGVLPPEAVTEDKSAGYEGERAHDQPFDVLGEWQIFLAEEEAEDRDCQKALFYGNWSNELKRKE